MSLPDSDDEILLLHNPRCSKSRAVHALLEASGRAFAERRYLEDPLSREELEELGRRLERPIGEWVRRKEAAWSEAGLTGSSSPDALLDAVARHPALLERPIVVRGRRAVVGRPPEEVERVL